MTTANRPPKPYESYLVEMLTEAITTQRPALVRVTVDGRTCELEFDDEVERYIVAQDVLERALGASVGAGTSVGEVTLLPYDEAAAAESFHDGLTWVDGPLAHWCLDPADCPDTPDAGARERLTAERERLEATLNELRRGRDADGPIDMLSGDAGASTTEAATNLGLAAEIERELAEVDAALQRLADGTYGIDEESGEPIDPARLAAQPAARTNIR